MAYRYVAYTPDKRIVRGVVDADSESAAEEALYQAGHELVLSLKRVRPGLALERVLPSLFGVKSQDVIDFSRQLAILLESGINILTALELLEGQSTRPALRRVIAGLIEELREGNPLSQALSKYPNVFSEAYRQVVAASEQAGNLEAGLRQISHYLERGIATRKKVIRAMAYPALVLMMAAGVSAILVMVVLPRLIMLFTSLEAELPWMTQLLVALASFLINYKLYILAGILALAGLAFVWVRLPAGRLALDKLMLRMPLIGSLNVERHVGHFCQTASLLLKAGLLLPPIMNIVIQTTGNRVVRQAFETVRDKLVEGQGLSAPLASIGLFPHLLVEMVAVGEKTGKLESTLSTLAEFYEQKVNQRIDTLISMIEPALTVAVGLVVAFIALSIITPLYSILRSIQ